MPHDGPQYDGQIRELLMECACEIVEDMTGRDLLAIPGVYDAVASIHGDEIFRKAAWRFCEFDAAMLEEVIDRRTDT